MSLYGSGLSSFSIRETRTQPNLYMTGSINLSSNNLYKYSTNLYKTIKSTQFTYQSFNNVQVFIELVLLNLFKLKIRFS